jgi:hypothetical protein
MVLYISCGEEGGPGRVYQVDENGRVLGIVNLPYLATGIALHRENGLVLALPRDGGKIMRIDDSGKLSTILEKDKEIVHPVDVAIAGKSDSVIIGDNISRLFGATTALGGTPRIYHRIEGQKWATPDMSLAVTLDKHVIYGTDAPEGIYRFAGDEQSFKNPPMLPSNGGVAADTATLKWAAAQPPNQVYVFEGEELVKKLRLPPGKSVYRHGLLSFAPASSVVVAARPSDEEQGQVWLIQYSTEKDEVRNLFPWDKERMVDFVVGPRMFWDRNDRSDYKSIH